MAWLIKLGLGCIWGIVVCAVILGMGMTSDYIAASAARSSWMLRTAEGYGTTCDVLRPVEPSGRVPAVSDG